MTLFPYTTLFRSINALKGTFAGNITIGGTTDGVCTILNAESTEVARIDNNGVSTFGSDTYGENIARLYGGYLRFYRDKNAVGHVGTSYAAVGEENELITGVALFTNGSGQWIGLGHEGKIYFMYHAPDDEFKMYKDLNMNGHRVYNAIVEGSGSGGGNGVGNSPMRIKIRRFLIRIRTLPMRAGRLRLREIISIRKRLMRM